MRLDNTSAECLVFTFKEGLLSKLAHDLKLRVTRFTLDVANDRSRVEAVFDARSLRVVSAMRDGAENRAALSARDFATIEKDIIGDVLHASRHPEVRFVASKIAPSGDGWTLAGELTLHGTTRALTLPVRKDGDRFVAEARLHQPDYGVRPFTAMLGTLRIQADVVVRISVPSEKLPPDKPPEES